MATPPSVRCTEVGMTAQPNPPWDTLGQKPSVPSKPAWLLGLRCFRFTLGQKPLSRANPHGYWLCPTLGHLFRSFSFIKEEKNNSNKSSNKCKGSSSKYLYIRSRRFLVSQASRAPQTQYPCGLAWDTGTLSQATLGHLISVPSPLPSIPQAKNGKSAKNNRGGLSRCN